MSVSSFQSGTSLAHSTFSATNSIYERRQAFTILAYKVHEKNAIKIEYSFIQQIGQGTFAKVATVNLKALPSEYSNGKATNELLAMKIIKTNLTHERDIHAEISGFHRNIVQLKYYFYTSYKGSHYLNLAMEYFPESLHDLISRYKNNQESIPHSTRNLFMKNVLSALEYLHGRDICHRDIKSMNILVDMHHYLLKLADFGSSKN